MGAPARAGATGSRLRPSKNEMPVTDQKKGKEGLGAATGYGALASQPAGDRHCLSQGKEDALAFHPLGLALQGGCAIVEPLVLLPSTNRECIMNRDIAAQFIKMLTNLDQCLAKAEAHAEAKKFNVDNFFNERLIVDMLPLSKQVLICCDSARAVVATASLSEPPVLGDDPKTMADLRAHVAKTIAYLQGKLDADFSQYASGHYYPYWAGGKGMDGYTCVHEYGIPNFYFHLTMTYALLRQAGVDLGKRDYLGGLNLQ